MVNWKRFESLTWAELLGFERPPDEEPQIEINKQKRAGPRVSSDILAGMFKEGKTIAEIARITGYRHQTVRIKLRKTGVRFAPKPQKVSDAVLIKLVGDNKNVAEIASAVKMSQSGVRVRLKRLGLDARIDKDRDKKSAKIYDTIVKMKTEGHKSCQIAEALNLSPAAVSWRIKTLKEAGRL